MSFCDYSNMDMDHPPSPNIERKFQQKLKSEISFHVEGSVFWDECSALSIIQLQTVYLDSIFSDPQCMIFHEKWKNMPKFKYLLLCQLASRARSTWTEFLFYS